MNHHAESIGRRIGRRLVERLVHLPRCQRGQAIYVVVVFFFLMAGLLFLVLNTGEKLNHKIGMQNAADAATATGAGWFARGLNTISMCNVTETQLLSLIVLCDTLETVTPPAQECIDDLVKNIAKAKAKKDIPLDDRLKMWLVVGNAQAEQEIITRFSDIVKAVNWPDYLTYDNGVLWECLKLIDGFSHAMRKDTPMAAQREAIDVAKKNEADFGFIVPLWPELPVVDGKWMDFKEPMKNAHLLPPHNTHVLGGFAYVMNYRGYQGQVMGPWNYWREPFVSTRPMGLFDLSRFSVMFNIVSQMKLDMMFGSTDDQVSLKGSEWEMDYDKAKKLPPSQIKRVWWEEVTFNARYPQPNDHANPWQPENPALVIPPFPPPQSGEWNALRDPQQPTPGTFTTANLNNQPPAGYIRATEAWEGADPREAVWYKVDKQRTAQYPQLGIFAPHPPTHPDGSPWPYTEAEKKTYYHVSLRRFNGAELQSKDTLHRLYLPPPGAEPLSPILMDPGPMGPGEIITTEYLNTHFTFNGFAYRKGATHIWAAKPDESGKSTTLGFENPNPIDQVIAYAQARVYQEHTWDSFTQYWRVHLVMVNRWPDLPAAVSAGMPDAGSALRGELTPEKLKPVLDMLNSYSPEFVKEVTH